MASGSLRGTGLFGVADYELVAIQRRRIPRRPFYGLESTEFFRRSRAEFSVSSLFRGFVSRSRVQKSANSALLGRLILDKLPE